METKNSILRRSRIKKSIKGQITIFLALVFMVLFTVFGMTISMGMFIHDKINLQNATDLASYYVATKQAEMLTAIGHTNYQIRQSWKLAVFRYRVMGNGARTTPVSILNPAIRTNAPSFLSDHSDYMPATGDVFGGSFRPPRVCIAAAHMFKDFVGDNLCKTINFTVNYVPPIAVIIPFGIVGVTNGVIVNTNATIFEQCSGSAYMNWWFANTIIGAHKLEQRDRRAVINALAENLSKPIAPGGMKDLDGNDVYDGAWKTFLYNLSESNRESMDANARLTISNSMSGVAVKDWLVPIYVNTSIPYSSFNASTGCTERLANHMDDAEVQNYIASGNAYVNNLSSTLDPDTKMREIGTVARYPDDLYNITIGVEKNPWYMVYNKVEAKTESSPLFLAEIFGSGIKLQSVAYSKPFGGRVGPWYNKLWPSGSAMSSGGGRTDSKLPQRVEESGIGAFSPSSYDENFFPNYSRYPEDDKGLVTNSAMVAAGRIIGWSYTAPAPADVKSRITDYVNATYSYFRVNSNDPLAQNATAPSGNPWDSFNRRMEIAAIAPDAFDMTYYNIVPGFYDYFVKDRLEKTWFTNGLPPDVEVRGDIGAYGDGPDDIKAFDIIDQMSISAESDSQDGIPRPRTAPWLNSEDSAFLTAWIPGKNVMDYGPADDSDVKDRFARCLDKVPEGRVKIPSECLRGGRAGYSVKIISKKYLESTDHPIGGGGATGAILNVL